MKSNLSRGCANLDLQISSLVGYFKKTSVFLIYALCFHEAVHDKWCLWKRWTNWKRLGTRFCSTLAKPRFNNLPIKCANWIPAVSHKYWVFVFVVVAVDRRETINVNAIKVQRAKNCRGKLWYRYTERYKNLLAMISIALFYS